MGLTSRDKRDAYYRLAKAHGYQRAALKLIQMEDTLSLKRCDARRGPVRGARGLDAGRGGALRRGGRRRRPEGRRAGRRGDHIGGGPDLAFGDRAHRLDLGRQGGRRIVRRRAGACSTFSDVDAHLRCRYVGRP